MDTRTTTALLEGLTDSDNHQIWSAFDQRFRPILVGMARGAGLTDVDAADVAQDALTKFVMSYRKGSYDRARGRLSHWLAGIARHCIADQFHKMKKRREAGGVSRVMALPDDIHLTQLWEDASDRAILHCAMERLNSETNVQARTIEAFNLVTIHRREPSSVAQELGMTLNDVYVARHRCLEHLRRLTNEIQDMYETTIDEAST